MTVPAAGRGTTTVAPRAVRRIAERAATEALTEGGAVTRASASVRGATARVTVGVRLPYPIQADEAAGRIRERAQTRTAALTGLSVPHADIRIDALSVLPLPPGRKPSDGEPPGPDDAARTAEHTVRSGGRGSRIRAQRRIPAVLTAAVAATGCALLLVDVVAVRLGGTPAAWRMWLVDWASTHGPTDTAVRAAWGAGRADRRLAAGVRPAAGSRAKTDDGRARAATAGRARPFGRRPGRPGSGRHRGRSGSGPGECPAEARKSAGRSGLRRPGAGAGRGAPSP